MGVRRGLLLGYQRNSVGIMEGERGSIGNAWECLEVREADRGPRCN